MTKFYGKVGFGVSEETSPGVYEDVVKARLYRGDVLKFNRRYSGDQYLHDSLTIGHQISIVADAFAYENFANLKYVEWMGVCWKVTEVEVQRPRLILTLGEVYNGPKP